MDPGWIPVKMPSFEAPRSEDTPSLTVVFERSAMAEATAGGFHARGICGRHDQGRRVAAAVLLFLAIICLAPEVAPAQGLCIPPLDALKRAMCSDPELRGLLEIGQGSINFLWPLLSPSQQQQFTADHRSWREAIAAGCRLADFSGLPLVAAVKDCLRDANQSRITWLRDYSAMPARGPPPRAPVIPRLSADVASTAAPGGPIRLVPPPSPQSSGGPSVGGVVPGGALVSPTAAPRAAPPAPSTAGVSPAPSIGSGTSPSTPQAGEGAPIGAVIVSVVILGILVAIWRARVRAAERRREIEAICEYFSQVNALRRFPEADVPVVLQAGEFGLLAGSASLWEMRAHHATAGGRVRIAKGVRVGAYRHKYSYRQLDRVASGTLVVTNRQVVFKSYERTVHFAYGELRDVQYDGHIRLLIGRRQTPIILSTARGNFVTMLIRIFAESTFRDGRLPEGLVVSARPNANDSGVDLSFDTVRQHPIAVAG